MTARLPERAHDRLFDVLYTYLLGGAAPVALLDTTPGDGSLAWGLWARARRAGFDAPACLVVPSDRAQRQALVDGVAAFRAQHGVPAGAGPQLFFHGCTEFPRYVARTALPARVVVVCELGTAPRRLGQIYDWLRGERGWGLLLTVSEAAGPDHAYRRTAAEAAMALRPRAELVTTARIGANGYTCYVRVWDRDAPADAEAHRAVSLAMLRAFQEHDRHVLRYRIVAHVLEAGCAGTGEASDFIRQPRLLPPAGAE